jgi:hypothetical protein
MQLDSMFLQLGIAGAMLLVGYRIVLRWMATQREAEKERTEAQRESEKERTQAIREGFAADIAAHNAIVSKMGSLDNRFSRVEGRIDQILELTPVREMMAVHMHSERTVIVEGQSQDDDDRDDTPVDMPAKRTATPPRGSPVGGGGYAIKRPKTQGGG